jgi:hypothetical protein
MDSTLDDKLAEEQITKSLEEQFSNRVNLAHEEEVGPLAPPTRRKTSRAPPATIHRSAGRRYVAFVGCHPPLIRRRWPPQTRHP